MSVNETYIIAEAGVNHNGSLDLAKQLIDVAVESGANAVKFQTFKAENLVSKQAEKADYQKSTTDASESQYEMLKKLELTTEDFKELKKYCEKQEIDFLSTPFDTESLSFLTKELGVRTIKFSSGDLTNAPLLLEAARQKVTVILSTGMSTVGEIEQALAILAYGYLVSDNKESPSIESFYRAYFSEEGQRQLKENVVVLHCTTEYPTPYHDVNLRTMDTIQQTFGVRSGLSDHTEGIIISLAAVARGARIIEKHFTLDKTMSGPDHQASLKPQELRDLVKGIRQIEQALGSNVKRVTSSETGNRSVARKSLVALRDIKKGEPFSKENITIKRPGIGISPVYYWDVLGKVATKDYKADDVIQ